MSIFTRLRHFDAYPKTLEDFRVKTLAGAFITVSCTFAIVILFLMEWKQYMTIEVDQELFVDLSRNQQLSIELNMTLSKLPCGLISIDASDMSGENNHELSKGLKKIPLNSRGGLLPVEIKTTTKTTTTIAQTTTKNNDKCMSCYGAEKPEKGINCCNTCDQVRDAYRVKGWQFIPSSVIQCVDEYGTGPLRPFFTNPKDAEKLLDSGEGCRLEGFITVNKIAGNIHIAPGITLEQNHQHYHSMDNLPIDKINTNHYFETFSFGDKYPNQFNPLELKSLKGNLPGPDNIRKEGEETNMEDVFAQLLNFGFFQAPTHQKSNENSTSISYRYFLKIVPTTYEYLDGKIVNNTYQYSVTRSAKVMTQMSANTMPGVFVTYELSPIMIRYIEKARSFSHFITSCCAIIGGLFTVAGMLDGFTFRYWNMYRKYQMNKLG